MSAKVIIGENRLEPHRLRAAILGEVHARPFRALTTPAPMMPDFMSNPRSRPRRSCQLPFS